MGALILILIIYLAFKLFKKAAPYIVLVAVLVYIYTLIKNAFIFTWHALTSVPGLFTIGIVLLSLAGYHFYHHNRCASCHKLYRRAQLVTVTDGQVCLNCLKSIGVAVDQLPASVKVERTFTVKEIKALRSSQTVIDPIQRWKDYQTRLIKQAKPATVHSSDNTLTAEKAASLRQLKQLLDDGVITQADFDAKKKQILGL